MRKLLIASALVAVTAGAAGIAFGQATTSAPVPAYAKAALADTARPAADVARDAVREPAEMLRFAGIKPGSVVAEMIPGGGYFTRIFGKAVMPGGHVYAMAGPARAGTVPAAQAIAADARYGGAVTFISGDLATLKAPRLVDVVWTSQNYHDLPLATRIGMNKMAMEMLKPGGLYIVLDHSAIVGTGDLATTGPAGNMHRIDENHVKLEVLRAGFRLVGENNILRNPKDPRTQRVFEAALGRDTDQFILKFQKPAK